MADNPYERDNPSSPASDGGTGAPSDAPLASESEGREDLPRWVEGDAYTGERRPPTDDEQPSAEEEVAPAPDGQEAVTQPLPVERTASPDTAPEHGASPAAPPRRSTSADTPATASATGEDTVTSTFDLRDRSGQHQAERPVPRSGLAEHRSAGYLTGELSPPQTAAAASPTAAAQEEAAATEPVPAAPESQEPRTGPDPAVLLDGATATPKLPSRAGAHVWTVVLTLLLTPVAWYLLADAGARLTQPGGNPWDTANLNVAALLELAGGLLVLAVVVLAARWSSVGAIVVGSLVLVVGVPFLAVPAWTQDLLGPVIDWLHTLGDFGGNVAAHLVDTGSTGRLVVYGLALVLIGAVSHGARRQGRREVQTALTT